MTRKKESETPEGGIKIEMTTAEPPRPETTEESEETATEDPKEEQKEITSLERCPFCGSDNVQIREDDGRYILCNTCHIEVRDHQGTDRQIEMWNRRGVDRLLPCPHCGGEPELKEYDKEDFAVECTVCHARTDWELKEEAIEIWNRRV